MASEDHFVKICILYLPYFIVVWLLHSKKKKKIAAKKMRRKIHIKEKYTHAHMSVQTHTSVHTYIILY